MARFVGSRTGHRQVPLPGNLGPNPLRRTHTGMLRTFFRISQNTAPGYIDWRFPATDSRQSGKRDGIFAPHTALWPYLGRFNHELPRYAGTIMTQSSAHINLKAPRSTTNNMAQMASALMGSCLVVLAVLTVGEAEAAPNNMTVLYMPVQDDPVIKLLSDVEPLITGEHLLDGWFDIPDRLFAVWTSCGQDHNAFYSKDVGAIVMCYEMHNFVTVLAVNLHSPDEAKLFEFYINNLLFIFLHELGQGIMHEWGSPDDWPSTTEDDDGVRGDSFAVYVMLREATQHRAVQYVLQLEALTQALADSGHVEGTDPTVEYFACMVYGKYPDSYDSLEMFLPPHHSDCSSRYDSLVSTWELLIEYRRANYEWNP